MLHQDSTAGKKYKVILEECETRRFRTETFQADINQNLNSTASFIIDMSPYRTFLAYVVHQESRARNKIEEFGWKYPMEVQRLKT